MASLWGSGACERRTDHEYPIRDRLSKANPYVSSIWSGAIGFMTLAQYAPNDTELMEERHDDVDADMVDWPDERLAIGPCTLGCELVVGGGLTLVVVDEPDV